MTEQPPADRPEPTPAPIPPPVSSPLPLPPPPYGTPPPSQPAGIPPPPPYAGLSAPGYAAPLPTTNTYAILALVLAFMSFLLCPIVPAVFALVIAGNAKRQIAASNGLQTGEGMVTAARVMSWINIALATIVIILFAVFVVFAASNASSISSVITNLPTQGQGPTN